MLGLTVWVDGKASPFARTAYRTTRITVHRSSNEAKLGEQVCCGWIVIAAVQVIVQYLLSLQWVEPRRSAAVGSTLESTWQAGSHTKWRIESEALKAPSHHWQHRETLRSFAPVSTTDRGGIHLSIHLPIDQMPSASWHGR